jgi:pimeloyl-ACP methyl ester carboxylesterase
MKIREELRKRGRSSELAVLIHGWATPADVLADARDAVAEELPDADLLLPRYQPTGAGWYIRCVFSNSDIYEITQALLTCVDVAVTNREAAGAGYRRILLIGYSTGALLARAIFVRACGESDGRWFQSKRREWVGRVERVILCAGMSRGWSLRPRPEHMSRSTALLHGFVLYASALLGAARLIRSLQRGRPFVVDLRVRWIDLLRKGERMPLTVQLLGTRDNLISRSDTVDLQCGRNFVYFDVPDSDHGSILDFSGYRGQQRKKVFFKALLTQVEELSREGDWHSLPAWGPNPQIEQVVFLMHGIRDEGNWPPVLGKSLEAAARKRGRSIAVVFPGYHYFPMAKFLFGWFREKNVLWFMDRYIEALARYPNARSFCFVGHSNGTYLLASALERYASGTFDRAVFAGSVVNRDFDWTKHRSAGRIGRIRNYVATNDWVVGIFSGIFETLGAKDLGTAGHNGFTDEVAKNDEVKYVDGGHAAAIDEPNHEAIMSFILGDDQPELNPVLWRRNRKAYAVYLSRLCWLVWGVLIAIVIIGPVWAIGYAEHKWMWTVVYLVFLIWITLTI